MDMDFIIPAYNEEENIAGIVQEIRGFFRGRIIVVDDFSKDDTFDRVPVGEGIIKIRNEMNRGKGYSIKRGLSYAEGELIALVDGDMRGIIKHINDCMTMIYDYDCTVFTPPIRGGGVGLLRKFAHYVVFRETGLSIPWCISGMRIIKKRTLECILDRLDNRFAFETSMTIELIKNNYRVNSIEVDFKHRLTGGDIRGYYHRGRQFGDIFKYYTRLRR